MEQIAFYEAKLAYEIDAWDLAEALKDTNDIVVVDVRSTTAYNAEHIPGARSIPHRTISATDTANLDGSKIYVTYCDGIGCNASTKGALKLARLGFRVKELLGGLDWWKRDGYASEGDNATDGTVVQCGC